MSRAPRDRPCCRSSPSPPGPIRPRRFEKGNPRYEFRREHDPDGTGKFYMGREIARVMGHQAADWLERPQRGRKNNPLSSSKRSNSRPARSSRTSALAAADI